MLLFFTLIWIWSHRLDVCQAAWNQLWGINTSHHRIWFQIVKQAPLTECLLASYPQFHCVLLSCCVCTSGHSCLHAFILGHVAYAGTRLRFSWVVEDCREPQHESSCYILWDKPTRPAEIFKNIIIYPKWLSVPKPLSSAHVRKSINSPYQSLDCDHGWDNLAPTWSQLITNHSVCWKKGTAEEWAARSTDQQSVSLCSSHTSHIYTVWIKLWDLESVSQKMKLLQGCVVLEWMGNSQCSDYTYKPSLIILAIIYSWLQTLQVFFNILTREYRCKWVYRG